jgi:hypothetical protein
LDYEKQQQILALGRLGWPLRAHRSGHRHPPRDGQWPSRFIATLLDGLEPRSPSTVVEALGIVATWRRLRH